MKIAEFDYDLPPTAIAQEPAPERDASRLLVLDRRTGEYHHRIFRELPDLLSPGDLAVVNRSRVFPARLVGRRRGGGSAEVFLLKRVAPAEWEAFVRPGRRLRPGDVVEVQGGLSAVIESGPLSVDARRRVRLLSSSADPDALVERLGRTPLPPYVRREPSPLDRERYQTVYAHETGSVAAPTAGLHFTAALLERLAARGIRRAEVLLHVGPGTFGPVQVDDVTQHQVEPEPYVIPHETAAAIRDTRRRGGRVVAIGTTTVRALETAARDDGTVDATEGETALVIVPGFRFRVVDTLVTNFHLPRSSLLLLVAAFAGRETILASYAEAIRCDYRFYSYGDAMLVV